MVGLYLLPYRRTGSVTSVPGLLRQAFFSWGTLISGVPAVAVWSLMGPIVGSIGAGVVLWAGLRWEMRSVAFAGSFGLGINLLNLIPVMPLDGGRVAANTGWFGLIPTLAVALAALYFTRSPPLRAQVSIFGYLSSCILRHRAFRSPYPRCSAGALRAAGLASRTWGLQWPQTLMMRPTVLPGTSASQPR